ncbi:glycosyltransferase family 2 protein [Dokdonia sp. Hel_I_53]|uniref:glycosyltransferase family 2 protein n=1 Tax=Dokdonia sp. Hel_I_53 TaxID=1566287 RepID=UPI00119A27E5|nr:glycosyltransferase family 2 protein [Dokdonia sp. Hel_I_53]TVZ52671.1 hypothetical protein OD90_1853 [Dokdonia sp. Hel_I_53]
MTKLTNIAPEKPLVSIITPLYNAQDFIVETIESVLSQNYINWEHIIVDDCSTDNSVSIVKEFTGRDERIKLISLSRNGGPSEARNKATLEAKGNYIAFLDADDLWHPQKLNLQIEFMQAHNCAVSFTSYVHINEHGDQVGKRIVALPKLSYKKQHSNNYIGNLTGVYNINMVDKILSPNIKKRQDWGVWLEAIHRSGKSALGIQKDLAYYRVHLNSMSSNKLNLVKYNYLFYRLHLGYGKAKSTWWLLRFFWEYFVLRPKWIQTYKIND